VEDIEETKMKTKRNIAICFGTLLILMGAFASTAAAEAIELGLSVSPENLVVGTNSKWVSVCFHVEDYAGTDDYNASDINEKSIIVTVSDGSSTKTIEPGSYDRFEYTDEDGCGYDELVLIYLAKDILDKTTLDLDDKELNNLDFTATGALKIAETTFYTKTYEAKITHINIPEGKGPGDHRPENPGSGEDGESDDQKGKKGSGGGTGGKGSGSGESGKGRR